jgi:hypothetical protein
LDDGKSIALQRDEAQSPGFLRDISGLRGQIIEAGFQG